MVLAKLVTTGKKKLRSVYDPTCGSGSLLLRVAKEVEEVGNFFGQELNRTTYNLARMNMILHDVHYRKFDIKQEDTLEHPQHINHRFEAIVANPPFSAQWSASPLFMSDDRFSQYGRLAPSGKADFAFVQHMIHHLADNGTMAIVLPHGVLFRGGAEQHIRKYLIEDRNYLDAVIGLPSNVFYGTSIPTCILVFKKCRENSEVLFIDASQGFEKVKTQNILNPGHIDQIIYTYRNRTEELKYSKLVSLKAIAENDYNLNIPRYVDTFEAEEKIDLIQVCNTIQVISELSIETDRKISIYTSELNLPTPLGNNLYLLEQYKKGVIQKIFSQEIRFKDDNGNSFPKWTIVRLDSIISNFIVPMRDKPKELDGEIPWCRIEDFDGKYLLLSKSGQGVTKGTVKAMNLKIYPINTLLVSCSANLGFCAIVKRELITNQTFIGLVPDENKVDVEFLFYVMILASRKLNILSSGTTISYLSRESFEKFEIKLPCLAEQIKIANFLSSIDEKINCCTLPLEKTEAFKKGLLQQMLV